MKSAIVKHTRIGKTFFRSDAAEVDRFLLRFLRTNKFNRKKSIQALENYILMRLHNPHWFMLLGDEKNVSGAMELIERGYVFVAPGPDKAGRRVLINLAERLDPSRHSSSDMMKAIMMCLETLLAVDDETQVRGLSYVFHCKGLGLRHCRIWSLFDARTMLSGCRKNIPLRHRAMFVVQTPFGMGSVIEFVRSFCDLKIKKRIHVVPQPEKLHIQLNRLLDDPDVLPVELLSSENGGRRTAQDMATAWKEVVTRHMPFLEKMDSLTVEDFVA